jgi:hypothetical protein
MQIGLVILFWLSILSVVVIVYFISNYLFKGSFIADLFQSASLVIVCFFVVGISVTIITTLVDRFCSSCVFYSSFGFYPTSEIKNLEGQRFSLGDSGYSDLEFYADKKTIQKIVNTCDFDEQYKPSFPKTDIKDINELVEKQETKIYFSRHFNSGFSFSKATLIYDEESEKVYFHWNGVD